MMLCYFLMFRTLSMISDADHSSRCGPQDIKSSNVIIFADRTAKLCDFGLARDAEGDMPVDRELVTLWCDIRDEIFIFLHTRSVT